MSGVFRRWTPFVRSVHRWVSLVFTVAVVLNISANLAGSGAVWVGLLALFPLLVLLPTGLWLFVLPYTRKAAGPTGG